MAKIRAAYPGVHTARSIIMSMSGMPAIWVIATALIPVPAPSTIQTHATTMTATSAATTTKRSRRSTASRTVGSVAVIAVPGNAIRGGRIFVHIRRSCVAGRSDSEPAHCLRRGTAEATGFKVRASSPSASASPARRGIGRSRCGRTTCWSPPAVSTRRPGFCLVREEPHRSFGRDLVGQYWELPLRPPGAEAGGDPVRSGKPPRAAV